MSSMPHTSSSGAPSIVPSPQTMPPLPIRPQPTEVDDSAPAVPESLLPNISELSVRTEAVPTTLFTTDQTAEPQTEYYDIDISPTNLSADQGTSDEGESDHPGFPWIYHIPGGTGIEIPNDQGEFQFAKYVRFGLDGGEPTVWGMEGARDGKVVQYAKPIYLQKHDSPIHHLLNHSDMSCFDAENMFRRAEYRAIELLGDFRVHAEVYRIHRAQAAQGTLQNWKKALDSAQAQLQLQWHTYFARRDNLDAEIAGARKRLHDNQIL